jgi:hypothetical protein
VKVKKLERPKSSIKYRTNPREEPVINPPKSKIYTTLNQNKNQKINTLNGLNGHEKPNHVNSHNKPNYNKPSQNLNTSDLTSPNISKLENSRIRATSSRPKKNPDSDLEQLINNHNFYNDKVEKIRNFINKY